MFCTECGKEIPKERMEALPTTTKCVKCSDVKPYFGLVDYPHKTGSYVVIIDPNENGAKENIRRAKRIYTRAR